MTRTPDFEKPPVVEMALGVQFRPLFAVRGITLAPLREQWRAEYPGVEEQPPLAPGIEGPLAPGLGLAIGFGPVPSARHWFLSEDGTNLVQVQNDRLIVNWRQGDNAAPYPRYERMRALFEERVREFASFLTDEQIGSVDIVQAEINYINAVPIEAGEQGRLGRLLRACGGTAGHHLGEPEQARVALAFLIPDVGQPPVRLHVSVDPAQRPDGAPVRFITLTARGAPNGRAVEDALKFLDEAHDHVTQSFLELTSETMHTIWGWRH
jgi:uncharacterized protein (TIGR04255 family)